MAITNTGTNSPHVGGAQAAATPLAQSTDQSNQFMQMLLKQLTNQDPTQPMSGSDMTQQMVGIQQIQSMATLQQQITMMNQGVAASAANIIGKTVQVNDSSGAGLISGSVTALRQSSANGIQIMVGGQPYSMSQITSISNS